MQESILEEAQRLTTQDRQETYGHPLDDFGRTAALFNALFGHKIASPFSAEDLQMTLVLVKLSRQMHMPKRDNLVDAAGYLHLQEMTSAERDRRKNYKGNTAFLRTLGEQDRIHEHAIEYAERSDV